MIFLDQIEEFKIYKKKFYPNIKIQKNKYKNNLCILLTPNYKSSIEILNNSNIIDFKFYKSYYLEKDIVYFINQESYIERLNRRETQLIVESMNFNSIDNLYRLTTNRNSHFLECNNMINISNTYPGFVFDIFKDIELNEEQLDSACNILYSLLESIDNTLIYENNKSINDILINRKYEIENALLCLDEKFIKNTKYKINEIYYNKEKLLKLIMKVNRDEDTVFDNLYNITSDLFLILGTGSGLLMMTSGDTFIPIGVITLLITALISKCTKESKASPDKILRFKSNIANLISDLKYSIQNETKAKNKEKLIAYYKELNECMEIINTWEKEYNKTNKHNSDSVSLNESTNEFMTKISEDYRISEDCIRINNGNSTETIIVNDYITEDSNLNPQLKKILYNDRIRKDREVLDMYENVKIDVPYITKTYLQLDRYRSLNLINDLSFYHKVFLDNNKFKMDKGANLYKEFLSRILLNTKFDSQYNSKFIIIPIYEYLNTKTNIEEQLNYKKNINIFSLIVRALKTNYKELEVYKDITFIILNKKSYFKLDLSHLTDKSLPLFKMQLKKLLNNKVDVDTVDIEDIEVKAATGKVDNEKKKELVDKINKAEEEKPIDIETEPEKEEPEVDIKNIIDNIRNTEYDKEKTISVARRERMNSVNKEFLNTKIDGKNTIQERIQKSLEKEELSETKLKIDSINDDWESLKFTNFEKDYDIDADIYAILESFSKKRHPLVVREISVEDSSTSEDFKYTYNIKFENEYGKRFQFKFDIPRLKDNKLMILGGNEKIINRQLTLLPVTKTDADTVQVVSDYKKIFIKRFGSSGKNFVVGDLIDKAINKPEAKVNTVIGNNAFIYSKYKVPIDLLEMGSKYSKIENKTYIIEFNIDKMVKEYNAKVENGKIPIAYNKKDKSIIYLNEGEIFSYRLYDLLAVENDFVDTYNKCKPSTKYQYSRAKILNNDIPLIVIMGYNEGLISAMDKAKIKYDIVEKRPKIDIAKQDYIKFKDGYIVYDLNYNSSLLMNGLKDTNTEDYSISDINNKAMYLDFLDLFGGRILADGLDNFYDLMIDPKTEEVLKDFNLPTDYIELLVYANNLLADNHYIKHTDLSNNRYRSSELIAGYVYQCLATAYGNYVILLNKGKTESTMTMKQSEVIDNIAIDPTFSDLSVLNPLTEIESINTVGFKGLAGLNADRSYDMEKRTFDESMNNILGLSSGFGPNSGITRQAVIDMNINAKGYLDLDNKKSSVTKTFTASEALTPFGTTRDDTARSAMTFIQTSKHGMRIEKSDPPLVSNGMEMAMPYLLTNTYAFKSKKAGKVIEKTDDYLIVEYIDKTRDFVDLRNTVKKNSNGGFFTNVKLSTDLKVGSGFKENQILAYDDLTFSNEVGYTDDLSYNVGRLTKIAILNAEEGYDDSAIVSDRISEEMATDIIGCKDCILDKNTNVLYMCKKGQKVKEGDTILLFQNSFEEEDANQLIKLLSDEEGNNINDLGRIPITSKYTGEIADIKMYRTVELDELSPSLQKLFKEYEKPINELHKKLKQNKIDDYVHLEPNYKLDSTGKLKNVKDGVYIEIFIKYHDKISVGDKIVFFAALKGVIRDIFPKGEEPISAFRPEEKIHAFLPLASVNKRMVCSIFLLGGLNKALIELDRAVKDMVGIPYTFME